MNFSKWLLPGMHIKRWLLALLAGVILFSLAVAMLIAYVYRNVDFPGWLTDILRGLTLQFIPHFWREIVVGLLGLVGVAFALRQLGRAILNPLMDNRSARSAQTATPAMLGRKADAPDMEKMVDIIYKYRFGAQTPTERRGLKIVAVGGGTGLSTSLRGLKEITDNLTAIVTVADDGGSSGRLRRDLGILPPGDIRNCLVALADAEPMMEQLLQYRFPKGSDLDGHSFGNLFLAAMEGVTGDFEMAVRESARILAVRGDVMPSTLANVELGAETRDGHIIVGESEIGHSQVAIKRVFLQPQNVAAYPDALRAILDADLIVLGPGSLYTSLMPNLLVRDIAAAVRSSRAVKVYVCNVATQPGETDNFGVVDHVRALVDQFGRGLFSYVLANDNLAPSAQIKPEWHVNAVAAEEAATRNAIAELGAQLVVADVVNPANPLRHDPRKLTAALLHLHTTFSRNDSYGSADGSDPNDGRESYETSLDRSRIL